MNSKNIGIVALLLLTGASAFANGIENKTPSGSPGKEVPQFEPKVAPSVEPNVKADPWQTAPGDVIRLLAKLLNAKDTLSLSAVNYNCNRVLKDEARGSLVQKAWAIRDARSAMPIRLMDEMDGFVPASFAAAGAVQRIKDWRDYYTGEKSPPFFMSAILPGYHTWEQARAECEKIGGKLPTKLQWSAIEAAISNAAIEIAKGEIAIRGNNPDEEDPGSMDFDSTPYREKALPGMSHHTFWANNSDYGEAFRCEFNDHASQTYPSDAEMRFLVRCVYSQESSKN